MRSVICIWSENCASNIRIVYCRTILYNHMCDRWILPDRRMLRLVRLTAWIIKSRLIWYNRWILLFENNAKFLPRVYLIEFCVIAFGNLDFDRIHQTLPQSFVKQTCTKSIINRTEYFKAGLTLTNDRRISGFLKITSMVVKCKL